MTASSPLRRARTAILLVVVLLIAAALRLPGYLLAEPLWVDEAWRAVLALDPDVVSKYLLHPSVFTAATAPLYVVLLKGFALFGVSELSLRATSFFSGILAVLLAWVVVARGTQNTTVLPLFAALLVAANHSFVRYSNELKPYMFEVVVHLALLYFWLRFAYAEAYERRRSFITLAGAIVVALLCGANVVFLIPALCVSALYAWVREPRTNEIRIMLTGFGAVFLTMGMLYFSLWTYGRDSGLIDFWSQGFNLDANESYAAFLVKTFGEISTDGAFKMVHHYYRGSTRLIPILWWVLAAATVVGIAAAIARRNFELVLFYAALVLTVIGLNFFTFWPLGAFGQNQFLYLHLIIGSVLFLNEIPWPLLRNAVVTIAVAIMATGWIKVDQHQLTMHASPPIQQSSRALAHVARGIAAMDAPCGSPRGQLVLNPAIGAAFDFYTRYHALTQKVLRSLRSDCIDVVVVPEAYSNAEEVRRKLQQVLRPGVNTWFAYGHLYGAEIEDLKRVAASFGRVSDEVRFTGAGAFRLHVVEEAFRHTK